MEIRKYTKDLITDVIDFEKRLREEEDFWGWEINEKYIDDVSKSFESSSFNESLSLLAYVDGKVVGRIDSSTIYSHFDGSKKAYLDWICVIKSCRHKFVRVTIPFAYERYFGTQVVEQKTEQKTEQKNLTQPERIKQIIIFEMENNPSITTMQLMNITGLKKTSIQNYIRELTSKGIIERVGAKKGGIWKVNK